MRVTLRKALLLLFLSTFAWAEKKAETPLDPDVQERLEAQDYLQFTDLDGKSDEWVQWNKDYRRWLFITKDQNFFVMLSGTIQPNYQIYLNDRPLEVQNGRFNQRVGILPEPSQVVIKIIDDKNQLQVFRSVYSWLRIPPSIRLKFREEGQEHVVEKSSGFSGELKKAAFTQLTSHGRPLVALDLDSQRRAGLLFQITFPREAEESYDGWRLIVLDKAKRLVAEVKKQSTPPPFVEWSEVQHKIVVPGFYSYRTDLYKGNKFFEGVQGHFDAVEGRALASQSEGALWTLEPKEEIGYFTYRNMNSVDRSNLYFGVDVPVAIKDRFLLRIGGLFSSLSPDPTNALTTARVGAGLRFAPERIDVQNKLTGRLDVIASYWTFGLYPGAPVDRISHMSLMLEPNLILWGVHYLAPTLELSASPSFNSNRVAGSIAYQFFVRPWNVKFGVGAGLESVLKHEPADAARYSLFRVMGSVAFLI